MMQGAAAGLWHLHSERVLHRDFAARNLLVCTSCATCFSVHADVVI